MTTIAADPKHLGAAIGVTGVLHTWGQNLDHHPHIHCIVPGGGIAPEGDRWVQCRPNFFLSVRVLSRLFRQLFLAGLTKLHAAGDLPFFNDLAPLAAKDAFHSHPALWPVCQRASGGETCLVPQAAGGAAELKRRRRAR